MKLEDQIREAFADTPAPGDEHHDVSVSAYDEGVFEHFVGTTWHQHTTKELRLNYVALSYFTRPALRYWLPAFMLAELTDPEAADVIAESIASRFHDPKSGRLFETVELKAVLGFLIECTMRYGSEPPFSDAVKRVQAELRSRQRA